MPRSHQSSHAAGHAYSLCSLQCVPLCTPIPPTSASLVLISTPTRLWTLSRVHSPPSSIGFLIYSLWPIYPTAPRADHRPPTVCIYSHYDRHLFAWCVDNGRQRVFPRKMRVGALSFIMPKDRHVDLYVSPSRLGWAFSAPRGPGLADISPALTGAGVQSVSVTILSRLPTFSSLACFTKGLCRTEIVLGPPRHYLRSLNLSSSIISINPLQPYPILA